MNLNNFMNSRIITLTIRTNKLTQSIPYISIKVLNSYHNCIGENICPIMNNIKGSFYIRLSFNYNSLQQYKDNL